MKQIILKKLIEDHYGYAEAVKRLRTNVKFCGSSIKVIAFTSSLPGEGKSDVTYALLQSLAQIGKKVILVDADIRKSVLVSRLEVRTKIQGLSEYLSGQCEMDDVICTTNYEGLDVVFAGSYSPNASELLEEERFSELICHLREMYDYVLIDTPPLGLVTDCAIVARHCNGIILVVEAGAISYRFLQKVQAQLEGTGVRILGAVLNKVSEKSEGYYGKYGKYGKYSKYDKYGKYGAYGESAEKEKRPARRDADQ